MIRRTDALLTSGAQTCLKYIALISVFIILTAACKPSLTADTIMISTATPSAPWTTRQAAFTPEPPIPYPIAGIPHCPGLQDLGYVLHFEWPDIENALEKLADYNWGYYQCAAAQADLKSLIQTKMSQPPYLWQQVAWVERGESTGSLYFHHVYQSYIYLWMLSQPDKKNSYLVIAKGDPGMPQTWDCRLPLQNYLSGLACRECRRSDP